ncbi:hypothetical protein GTA07_29995, partial [Rhodococcus hoagii]|nr:hypothetical protein [Prescottella equi]
FKSPQALMPENCPARQLAGRCAGIARPDAPRRFDNGGFKEPHLPHWVFDPYAPLSSHPCRARADFLTHDIDANLFEAKRSMLLELADRSAMSNSEIRWQSIKTFAWQLLNVVAPVLPGPISTIALAVHCMTAVAEP